MPTVLSTKKLKENQRSLLLNAGISLVEYNAIKIESIPFEAPLKIENAIFTSQNAVWASVNSVLRQAQHDKSIKSCFCVGEKTKLFLENNGFNVVKMTEYASELADYIVKNHQKEPFHFFCGNIRSDEIPTKLKENNIALKEIEVYKTMLNPKKFERSFDAVLFYSPSGVRSFFTENMNIEIAICIGKTTASEAKKNTENVVIANDTTIESVISKTVKTLG